MILSVSTFAYTMTWQDNNLKSLTIDNKVITIKNVEFVCENQPSLNPRNELPSYYIRKAPQGNLKQTSECIRQSVSTQGTCAEYKHTIETNEQNNPSCWVANGEFLNKNKLIYNTPTEINPYVTASYTTDAETNNERGIREDYQIQFSLEVDVKNGLDTSIEGDTMIESEQEITIDYDNKILDGLQGGIEIKQLNRLFFVFSKVDIIPVTFKKGNGKITFKLDNARGDKDIVITPFVSITEHPTGKEVIFVGKEIQTHTKVITEHQTPIEDTVKYNLPNLPDGTPNQNTNELSILAKMSLWVSSFNNKIEGWFN